MSANTPLSSPSGPPRAGPSTPADASQAAADAASRATRFVLVQPSHPGNVGAAARAMKVMGFTDLVLVAPRQPGVLSHEDAVAMASGAADILARARCVPDLETALDGVTHACATAMTPRDFGPPTHTPRAHFAQLAPQALAGTQRVALVFGNERYGMANEDVWRCHACLSIPTHPEYGSLNLAQALQLIAYDWRQALGSFAVAPRTRAQPPAGLGLLAGTLAHWQQVLVQIGFLNPAVPKKLVPRLRQLLLRAQPSDEELHILRGIARAVGVGRQGGASGSDFPAAGPPMARRPVIDAGSGAGAVSSPTPDSAEAALPPPDAAPRP